MKLCLRLRSSTYMSIYYSYLTEIHVYYKCSLGLVEAKIKTTKPWEQHILFLPKVLIPKSPKFHV